MINPKFCLIVLFVTTCCSSLFGQTPKLYEKALQYIADDNKGRHMLVSDSTYHFSFADFSDEIDTLWKKGDMITFHILDSVYHAHEGQKLYIKEFKHRRFHGKRPSKVIFFSEFYSNMVIGEILEVKDREHAFMHDAQASFTEAAQYLFAFDDKGELKKVFKVRIAYD